MSHPVTHIVHKLNLQIEAPNERAAKYFYQHAGSLLKDYVLPQLDNLLAKYNLRDEHIRLEVLDIDLNFSSGLSVSALEEMIKHELSGSILKQLDIIIKSKELQETSKQESLSKVKFSSDAEQITEAFLYFLENGFIPWWVTDSNLLSDSGHIIQAIIVREKEFAVAFTRKIQENPVVLKRFLLQYDHLLLTYLFSVLAPLSLFMQANTGYNQLQEMVIGNKKAILFWEQKYWSSIWTLFPLPELFTVSETAFSNKLKSVIQVFQKHYLGTENSGFSAQSNDPFPLNKTLEWIKENISENVHQINKSDQLKEQIKNGLVADRAGLILLHPFLQYFFMEFGLLKDSNFADDACKETAVHLLHYLATKEENAPEFELVFEKYLCGLDPSYIINRFIPLTESMKTEAMTLLQSVVKHWQVLKNTSAEGLQEGFLQRKGKLTMNGKDHRLQMEQNALDVLLEQIPWGVSLIKLPWLDQMIYVDW